MKLAISNPRVEFRWFSTLSPFSSVNWLWGTPMFLKLYLFPVCFTFPLLDKETSKETPVCYRYNVRFVDEEYWFERRTSEGETKFKDWETHTKCIRVRLFDNRSSIHWIFVGHSPIPPFFFLNFSPVLTFIIHYNYLSYLIDSRYSIDKCIDSR